MNCLVLGGAGFIGSHIVDALLLRNHSVRVFDLPNISTRNLKQHIGTVEIMGGDFNNENDISLALEGIDVVVHLICTTLPGPSNENPAYDVESNVIGTLHLLEKALHKGVRKIIFASSGGTVYGIPLSLPIQETHQTNPLCSYGITKLAIEKYLALYHSLHKLDYVILRLANPYGERQKTDSVQGAIAVFLGKILRKQTITIWGDGSVARDYFFISDLVSAFIRVIESDTTSNIYNIGSGQAVSLNEILSVIQEVTGRNPVVEFTRGRELDVPANCLNINRAKEELEWHSQISLKQGIDRAWTWLQAYNKGQSD
ncbi:NAD-dependent epimerase/dehydratase family protein [Desulfococcaceae bacterium HSG8]|nr:NAD-dependent epimerase/dehydratase family protein [Desulfococcaceae bacterium HSG8]